MNQVLSEQIVAYLKYKEIPTKLSSTKSNFIATASKYTLNKNDKLMRNNLPVVLENMQEEIYKALHKHSGRIVTWNRIKSR